MHFVIGPQLALILPFLRRALHKKKTTPGSDLASAGYAVEKIRRMNPPEEKYHVGKKTHFPMELTTAPELSFEWARQKS